MVAGRNTGFRGSPVAEEVASDVANAGRKCEEAGGEVEPERDRYRARAAANSASKSGSSDVS